MPARLFSRPFDLWDNPIGVCSASGSGCKASTSESLVVAVDLTPLQDSDSCRVVTVLPQAARVRIRVVSANGRLVAACRSSAIPGNHCPGGTSRVSGCLSPDPGPAGDSSSGPPQPAPRGQSESRSDTAALGDSDKLASDVRTSAESLIKSICLIHSSCQFHAAKL